MWKATQSHVGDFQILKPCFSSFHLITYYLHFLFFSAVSLASCELSKFFHPVRDSIEDLSLFTFTTLADDLRSIRVAEMERCV